MGGATLFDHDMNFVLLCQEFDQSEGGLVRVRWSERRGVLSEVDMRSYKSRQSGDQLLEDLLIYATSPQDYFEIMTTCGSLKNQPRLVNGAPSPDPWLSLFRGKRAFFASLREQSSVSDCGSHRLTIAGGPDFTLADLCMAFNPGSLALLSIPAYLVMDWKSGFAPPQPQLPMPIGRWLYDLHAPGGISIKGFDDYCHTFLGDAFLMNNSDVFLTTYALAHAIVVFTEDIQNYEYFESATSFRDYFTFEPLVYVFETLVRLGALRDPWAPVWKTCDTGIENAQEVNPDLAATLRLTDALSPITTTPALPPGAIQQTFYGLMDVLPLREYFGIDRRVKFEYPAADDAHQYGSALSDADPGEEIPF